MNLRMRKLCLQAKAKLEAANSSEIFCHWREKLMNKNILLWFQSATVVSTDTMARNRAKIVATERKKACQCITVRGLIWKIELVQSSHHSSSFCYVRISQLPECLKQGYGFNPFLAVQLTYSVWSRSTVQLVQESTPSCDESRVSPQKPSL